MDYSAHFSTTQTPQTEPIPCAKTPQVPNSAGGFAWQVDDWARLVRFLVLGSEGGTYYIGERALTIENAEAVLRCLAADGPRVVRRIIAISDAGRAPKNDPALFALALAMKKGDLATRQLAHAALPLVARTGTHLFHLAQYVRAFGGITGSGIKRAFARWYTQRTPTDLALQLAKYQQRDGWSHRDILRLAHPLPLNPAMETILGWTRNHELDSDGIEWAAKNDLPLELPFVTEALFFLQAVNALQSSSVEQACALIHEFRIPRECVPTEMLDSERVWDAMLPHMGLTAVIRNLGKMTSVGLLLDDLVSGHICSIITDAERLKRARVHPVQMLLALATYQQGHGERGHLSWTPVRQVVDALDAGFYASFGNVEPSGKRICYALDVSSSMDGNHIAGTAIDARTGAAAMALVCARTEPHYEMMAFSHQFVPLPTLSPRQRLDDVVRLMRALPFGGTDCALPMRWALQEKRDFDAFVVFTDSETWAGNGHPAQWLREYRSRRGIAAKLVVVGMTSNGFSIADPDDKGMLDCVGFDTSTPNVISDFIRE
jgi:60 kDa SS-A/Ro ribonucleoprotein